MNAAPFGFPAAARPDTIERMNLTPPGCPWLGGSVLTLLMTHCFLQAAENPLQLTLRSRVRADSSTNDFMVKEQKGVTWDPRRTAIIICDMWDDHWCKSAARRVAELAGPMNAVVRASRARGIFIIHAPSSVTKFYDDTPQRQRARQAP